MPWDPKQYHKFQSQRSAPFYDLLALVEKRPHLRVVDLGCGTGELTRQLANALPDGDVIGMDSSSQMLEKAAAYAGPDLSTSLTVRAASDGGTPVRDGGASLRFEQGDQAQLTGEWDLIFSNAALQWSEDHAELIPRLYERLAPGGQIVVQVPSNHNHISHQIYREAAGEEPFRSILNGFQRYAPVLSIDDYARLLFECGAEDILVFEKVYPHILEDSDAVVEWISGTALVPYFERLGEHKEEFVEAIRAKMRRVLPDRPVFYPFRRTLFSAKKPK